MMSTSLPAAPLADHQPPPQVRATDLPIAVVLTPGDEARNMAVVQVGREPFAQIIVHQSLSDPGRIAVQVDGDFSGALGLRVHVNDGEVYASGYETLAARIAADHPDADGDELDEAVHDHACAAASRINNGGLVRQIVYLLQRGESEQEIRDAIEAELAASGAEPSDGPGATLRAGR